MSLIDKLLSIGEKVVVNHIPYGESLISIVKGVIGIDSSINDETVTGAELAQVIEGLDSTDVAKVVESYNAVLMNESDNYRKMQETFAEVEKTGKSKRGEISMMYAKATVVWITAVLLMIGGVAYETHKFPSEWVLGTIFAFPFAIVGQYFGIKSSELKQLAEITSPTGVTTEKTGLLGTVIKTIKK